jgi:hypothetical protein
MQLIPASGRYVDSVSTHVSLLVPNLRNKPCLNLTVCITRLHIDTSLVIIVGRIDYDIVYVREG